MATKNLSRREFFKGAAVAGAAAAATILLGTSPAHAAPNVPVKWDKEVDVVVVGSGTVIVAALAAADEGLSTLVLEKAKFIGGTTITSGAGMWVPNNYLMQAEGAKDSFDEAFEYLKAVSQGQSSDELMKRYLEMAPEMILYLRDKAGFDFQRTSRSFSDYYPFVKGAHYGDGTRLISPKPIDKQSGGLAFYAYAQKALDARKVEVLLETPGKRLVVNEQGQVIGILAESQGKEIAIKANRGVVLGTGGFEFNPEMRAAFLRGPIFYSNGAVTNTGDGHLMGMAVGAALGNMNSFWGLPGYVNDEKAFRGEGDWAMYRSKPGSITVNKYGERFMNESVMYHPAVGAWYFYDTGKYEYRNLPSFALFDSGYTQRYPLPGAAYKVGVIPETFTKADTLEELAQALGIDPVGLKATVERFNENAKNGVDPDWHRGESENEKLTTGDPTRTELKNPVLAPLETPPFYGRMILPGTCGTSGGLKTDINARVLNAWGEPIGGLYATGNTMASVMGAAYPGGGATVGQGCTFAYIAAKHLATLKPNV